MLRVVLPADTGNIHDSYYQLVCELPFILTRISRMHQTRPTKRV